MAQFINELKTKEVAMLDYMAKNLLDNSKIDEIKYASAQKDFVSEMIKTLENSL